MQRLKPLLARALCSRLVGSVISHVAPQMLRTQNVFVDVSHPAIGAREKAQLFWGLYERAELQAVQTHLRADLDVIELGACIGVVSSAIASRLAPTRQLVAVEMNSLLLPITERNVSLNSTGIRASFRHGVVWYSSDTPTCICDGLLTASHAVEGRHPTPASDTPQVTLSRMIREYAIGSFTLVCDIEGAEVEMFLKDSAALAGCEQIIAELHDADCDGVRWRVSDVVSYLTSSVGFALVWRHGPVCVFERSGRG